MRKILLATTALVAFAGAAQAAESPISVNVGGYVDFRAAQFHESDKSQGTSIVSKRRSTDFETEYRLNISAEGKAANGIEYGGLVSLWNGAEYTDGFTGGQNSVHEDQAYVWMSGAWGKVILGDDHGASDLSVYAPTVGEGQVDGTYTDFTDPSTLAVFQPGFIDEAESSTKVTYYTPKVGNENHKLQLGASFAPNFYDVGQNVVKYDSALVTNGSANASYKNYVEAVAQYTGNWSPVNTVISANISTADAEGSFHAAQVKSYTSWGVGAQAMYNGWTVGASYADAGRFGAVEGQNKDQSVWGMGVKYEFDKVALALNTLRGHGYYNSFAAVGTTGDTTHDNYVSDYSALGMGATYTWFPGLTTAADAVLFTQNRADDVRDNDGHVFMVSQKITF